MKKGPFLLMKRFSSLARDLRMLKIAKTFVKETQCDWLSVAVGNIHGSISKAVKDKKKVQAKLNLVHLDELHKALGIPLVLHGGSGIQQEYVLEAFKERYFKN